MTKIIIEIDNPKKVSFIKELFDEMTFVKKVSFVNKSKDILEALQEKETIKSAIVKRKNPAMLRHL